MQYKYQLKNATQFGWPGLKGYAFNSANDFAEASAVLFEVTDRHGRVRNTLSDRIYLVLEGEGEFDINGEKIPVQPYDVIIVPKNTEYDYRGNLKLFLVHSPAYDPASDVDLESRQD